MSGVNGKLDSSQLNQLVKDGRIETVVVGFTDLYGRLIGKRFAAQFFLDQIAQEGTHACDYLLTVDMEMEPVPGYRSANWEKGYGDFHLAPDLGTLRVAAWLDRTAIVLCDVRDPQTHQSLAHAPRSLLRQQVERTTAQGYTALGGSEIEYYLFRDSYREAVQKRHTELEASGWYLEDYHTFQGARTEDFHAAARRHLGESGIPVECTKGEWGCGQHELNIRYSEVLEMADRHALYKQCLKELADQMGASVTFMAKYSADGAGSSCHVHLSLSSGKKNLFSGDQALGPLRCNDKFRWFLGGWIAHAAELMVFYAPTVNSYKRYQAGSWAPTRLAWSHDNRTAGFRVVGVEESLRIECRIPGSDCNPYLAYAAALASGLDGLAQRTEPPDRFEGDVYHASEVPQVPRTLREATELFDQSGFTRSVFGDDVVDHYVHFFRTEQQAFDNAVTDWERQRYFERI